MLPFVAVLLLVLLLSAVAVRLLRAPLVAGRASSANEALPAVPVTPPIISATITPPSVRQTEAAPPPPTPAATTAATPTQLPEPQFSNPIQESYQQLAAAWGVDFIASDLSNTGLWQFAEDTLVHPLALETSQGKAYIIDSGRVLSVNLQDPNSLEILLAPGDLVEGVVVLEPLDLALVGRHLFILDRAGDVYKYDLQSSDWQLDLYERPVEESSGHYFVALAAERNYEQEEATRALLEANYKFVQQYGGEQSRIWRLPEFRSIDIANQDGDVYVLQRGLHDQQGVVGKYRDASSISSFRPRIEIEEPRQIIAAVEGIYVLDQGGRRLLQFEPQYGTLIRIVQLPQEQPVSAVAVDGAAGTLLFAGQDRLYFLGEPERRLAIGNETEPTGLQAHDPAKLAELNNFVVPIGGSNITFRDFQLPGAPRHYRLGVHRGFDLYWQPGTKVIAAGDGTVIRADTGYVDPSAADLAQWFDETNQNGYTPEDVLDNYMGRQVWIEHAPGVVSRYAHLRDIELGIESGAPVQRGQVIGEVGNSGSPASLESESSDAHLHFELWIGQTYLGQYLRPIEARDWIEELFPTSR